eukprot:3485023-Pyramimonas_sp.AAC.2
MCAAAFGPKKGAPRFSRRRTKRTDEDWRDGLGGTHPQMMYTGKEGGPVARVGVARSPGWERRRCRQMQRYGTKNTD